MEASNQTDPPSVNAEAAGEVANDSEAVTAETETEAEEPQGQVYELRTAPKEATSRKYHLAKFPASLEIDFTKMTQPVHLVRDGPARPAGYLKRAGAYYVKEHKRLEAERNRLKAVPWNLEDYDGSHAFTGTCSVATTSARYVFFTARAGDDCLRMIPSTDWYNFKPKKTHQTLTLEQAEEKIGRRGKASWMMKSFFRNKSGEIAEDEDASLAFKSLEEKGKFAAFGRLSGDELEADEEPDQEGDRMDYDEVVSDDEEYDIDQEEGLGTEQGKSLFSDSEDEESDGLTETGKEMASILKKRDNPFADEEDDFNIKEHSPSLLWRSEKDTDEDRKRSSSEQPEEDEREQKKIKLDQSVVTKESLKEDVISYLKRKGQVKTVTLIKAFRKVCMLNVAELKPIDIVQTLVSDASKKDERKSLFSQILSQVAVKRTYSL